MVGRSPARFLAPLALVAVIVALVMVVSSSQNGTESTAPSQSTGTTPAASPEADKKGERKGRRRYTVRPGDTPSSIAEKTLRLNPNLDPQTLSPGERIKLRQ
jgi:LysM repeat protein